MKRKILGFFLSLTIIFTSTRGYTMSSGVMEKLSTSVISQEETNTFEKLFSLEELGAYKNQDTYMIPVRIVAERLGYEVSWDRELKQINMTKDLDLVSLKEGEAYYFKGQKPIKLGQAPELREGVSFVPLEFFSTILDQHLIITGSHLGIYKTETSIVEKEDLELVGYIKGLSDGPEGRSILTSIDRTRSEMDIDQLVLHVFEDTQISNTSGESLGWEDLKLGDRVELRTPRYMTMSLPAQTRAQSIVRSDFLVLEDQAYQKEDRSFSYPVLTFQANKTVESLFNQKLDEYIGNLKTNDLFNDLDSGYTISYIGEDLISIIFSGKFTFMGSERELIKVLNLDLRTGEEVNFENYFKKDQDSQEELEKIIRSEVKKGYGKDFQAEEVFIYFTESNLVIYYYELDDSAITPIEIYLDREKIKDLVK